VAGLSSPGRNRVPSSAAVRQSLQLAATHHASDAATELLELTGEAPEPDEPVRIALERRRERRDPKHAARAGAARGGAATQGVKGPASRLAPLIRRRECLGDAESSTV